MFRFLQSQQKSSFFKINCAVFIVFLWVGVIMCVYAEEIKDTNRLIKSNEIQVTAIDKPQKKESPLRTVGLDRANFPNSAYTLLQGDFIAEVNPVGSTGAYSKYPSTVNIGGYLLRYGLIDRVELRLISNGYTETTSHNYELNPLKTETTSHTYGFNPLNLDTKIHFWDEQTSYYLPAVGFEFQWQSNLLASTSRQGPTEPSFSLNFDQQLPFDIGFEYNVGIQRLNGQHDLGYQPWRPLASWSFQHDIIEDVAFFINGRYNNLNLPAVTESINTITITHKAIANSPNMVGAGMIWTVNDHIGIYWNAAAGVTASSPSYQTYAGFGWTP